MSDPNWTLEWMKFAQGLLGALVGGGLVLLGGWLADRRKARAEYEQRGRQEKALLTGVFAVRNYVISRIKEWDEDGLNSKLEPLQTAQAYVHRLIEKAPSESEILMITVLEIGLALDALLDRLDKGKPQHATAEQWAETVTKQVKELVASLEMFDIVSNQALAMMTEEELAEFDGIGEPDDPDSGVEQHV